MVCILLFVVVAWVFLPATRNEFLRFDDSAYISANAQVQSGLSWDSLIWAFRNPVAANWHPLTVLSHMLDCQLYGLKPWGHHLSSVLLHAVNTVLVFLVFWRLTGLRHTEVEGSAPASGLSAIASSKRKLLRSLGRPRRREHFGGAWWWPRCSGCIHCGLNRWPGWQSERMC
jgi:hypothetical protein